MTVTAASANTSLTFSVLALMGDDRRLLRIGKYQVGSITHHASITG